MPKLRRLSGSEVVNILGKFEFMIFSQRGEKQTLTIPNHPQLDTGTCKAIFRQASRYINAIDLKPYFYSD